MSAMKKKAFKTSLYCRIPVVAACPAIMSIFAVVMPARAQVGLSYDMADETAAQARSQQAQVTDYTFKSGDFRVLLSPSLSVSYNDNINCTESGKQGDVIILPTLGILMSYPLTKQNILQLDVTVGYNEYLNHSSLSSWYLSSGSALSYTFFIKDVMFNVHDQFSYVQNSSSNPQVSGTGIYGTFENSAGIVSEWDLKHFSMTLGYDHQNTLSTSSQFNNVDNSGETGYARLGYNWNSALTTGLEGTVAYTAYNQNILNDNTAYSAGVYADWHPDKFIHIEPRIGYSYNQFDNTSTNLQTANQGSWYADLNITHQLTPRFSYSLEASRNSILGVQSDLDEVWNVNAGITWNFIRNFSFQPNLFFQHGNQGAGTTFLAPNSMVTLLEQEETYNWYGGSIAFSYAFTKRFAATLTYTIIQRDSNIAGRGYTQNVVGIQITYHPI
jgi:hypothetical protein